MPCSLAICLWRQDARNRSRAITSDQDPKRRIPSTTHAPYPQRYSSGGIKMIDEVRLASDALYRFQYVASFCDWSSED